ncbi:catechol 2,3-dioxygenase [Haloplanus vescus]|uniref:Catechol 2,3-dioxygenase n=1 Tax=Haloplanus vescus TaxID=555874 RepID=A0A1H3YEU2_9EURY|nr:VOC family protein [Haloplanus vescus]SEA09534.1 catechol 2,3-dioxygenase [Haloplanus vescus]
MTERVGPVTLDVTELDRMATFYEDVVGLRTLDRTEGRAVLGVDDALLILRETPDRSARGPAEAGLFHTAFRVPSRAALGDALARIESQWQLTGASDHGVSEALYLQDPEDNGVEVYRDRPREDWPDADGRVDMFTRRLALAPLRDGASGEARCPSGTAVGHVHLEVSSLDDSVAFYGDGLGLDIRQSMDGALFLAFDGYHHHVGLNTWNERSRPAAGRGLARIQLRVDDPADVRRRLDPSRLTERDDGFDAVDPDGITVQIRRA